MTQQTQQPNFGPYQSWPGIKEFFEISARAVEIYHEKVSRDVSAQFTPTQHLFVRLLYLAETTSFSTRLLTSWCLILQALALARVRLEQPIVSSYLVHEKQELALDPFVRYLPISRYRHVKDALKQPSLEMHFPSNIDIEKTKLDAIRAQKELNADFEAASERFQRKWTDLDLLAMVQRRDSLAATSSKLSRHRLELDYISLNKAASSIVHSDCASLSYDYLEIFFLDKDQPGVLMPKPSWALIVASFCAHHDILQFFEILNWLGIETEADYANLQQKWFTTCDMYIRKGSQ